MGKIFVVQCSTTKTTNLPHENYLLYGIYIYLYNYKEPHGRHGRSRSIAVLLQLEAEATKDAWISFAIPSSSIYGSRSSNLPKEDSPCVIRLSTIARARSASIINSQLYVDMVTFIIMIHMY